MKKNFWLIIGAVISSSAWADQPAVPAATSTGEKPAQVAPATRPRAPRRTPPNLRTVPLVPGPALVAVSPVSRVNVRGQPKLKSEVITQMTNGEPVTVVEEIHLSLSLPEEPSAWAKIVLPDKVHPWVNVKYVDQTNMTVKASKLNLRAGAGQQYSVLGSLKSGDTLKEISRKGDWIEVETTEPVYAYMAAQYLKQEPAAAIVSTEPTPTPTPVTETTVATTTTEMPVETPATTITATTEVATTTSNILETAPPEMTSTPPTIEEPPPPPRIVQREGIVRGTLSIQAPTKYELISPENRRTINYLFTTSPELDLSRYKGLHIVVSGQEGLDERWRNTPVLTIESIHVVD